MIKINLKKFLPLTGIAAIGVSSAIATTAIVVPNISNYSEDKLDNKVLNYAINNLSDLNILNSPTELANYLDDYGVFGYTNSNLISTIDVVNIKSSDGVFYVKLGINFVDDARTITDWLVTSIPATNNIGTINFDNLKKQFLTFNDIKVAFDLIYSTVPSSTTPGLINLITTNTGLSASNISRASVNISNDFGTDSKTLSFDLTLVLNDCNSNGKTTVTVNLPTSYKIDWNAASQNFSKCFNVDDNGTTITSIKDAAASQEILIIPETYTSDEGVEITIDNIQSFLPESTTTINTKIIIMPNSVKVIGNNAFGVEDISGKIFSNLKWMNLSKQLSTIGDFAFANCSNLQNLPIYSLNHLLSIGQGAFLNCTSLTDVYMNDVVQIINQRVFEGCSNLAVIRLSRSPLIKTLPQQFFKGCSSLKNVVLPKTITTIQNYAFNNCTTLTYVNIPYNLTSFGQYVFQGVNSLKNIVFLNNGTANQIQFGEYAFVGMRYSNYTNIYIFGEYNKSRIFWVSFKGATNINVSVSSQTVANRISGDGNNFDMSRVFVMDPENLPYVKVSNIPEFIKYWQDIIKTPEDLNFEHKKVNSFKTASTAVGGVISNNDWVSAVDIINIKNNNNEVVALQFQVWLKNGQYFEINVNLLTPISLESESY